MEKVVQVKKPVVGIEGQSEAKEDKKIMHDFDSKKGGGKQHLLMLLLSILVIFAGSMTGWFLSNMEAKSPGKSVKTSSTKTNDSKEIEVADESAFPDMAEGTLVEGGIDGEGTHYLDRDLGPEKYVYLTSSVIDLDSFIGKKVQVWGQTLAGQKAGWLMDVGKVKIVE